jgi:putative acetyltransferase
MAYCPNRSGIEERSPRLAPLPRNGREIGLLSGRDRGLAVRDDFGNTPKVSDPGATGAYDRPSVGHPRKRNKKPMEPKIAVRSETDADVNAIAEVTVAAFKTLKISPHTESFIIAALRAANALTVSLVAETGGRVVGHIAFSPVTLSDGTRNWYGLGPVSVLPACQRQGIGKALIREGLSRLKQMKAQGCCLVGHPDYYRKLGFKNIPGLVHEGVPPEVFFALSFDGRIPQGAVTFHEGFKADGRPRRAGDAPEPA